MKTCDCPVPTVAVSLPEIDECPVNTGQIQRIIFVDRDVQYPIASLTSDTFWADKQTTTGTGKCIFTPLIGNPEFEPGDPIEFGGGNETIDGIPLIVGNEPTPFSFRFYSLQQGMAKAMKVLSCRAIDAYFINQNNQIVYNAKSTTTATGFIVQAFNIKDRRPGGQTDPDYNEAKLTMEDGWSDDYALTEKLTWNPMTI